MVVWIPLGFYFGVHRAEERGGCGSGLDDPPAGVRALLPLLDTKQKKSTSKKRRRKRSSCSSSSSSSSPRVPSSAERLSRDLDSLRSCFREVHSHSLLVRKREDEDLWFFFLGDKKKEKLERGKTTSSTKRTREGERTRRGVS